MSLKVIARSLSARGSMVSGTSQHILDDNETTSTHLEVLVRVAAELSSRSVVTNIEGTATVARLTPPQAQPLHFKNDVFLRDRIATGERSFVRVLFGGKATVTARERSVLTITEKASPSSKSALASSSRQPAWGWKTISSNAPGGWDATTTTFDLRAEGSDTVLSFAHRGFAQADEGFARVTTGWGYYLVSLQLYLETGKGDGEPWPALGEVMAGIADTLNVRAILVESRVNAGAELLRGGGGEPFRQRDLELGNAPRDCLVRRMKSKPGSRQKGHRIHAGGVSVFGGVDQHLG